MAAITTLLRRSTDVRSSAAFGQTGQWSRHGPMAGFDPGCVKTLKAFVGAQQKNRTCGLSESFMRGRHPIRIYLLLERPANPHGIIFSSDFDVRDCSDGPKHC